MWSLKVGFSALASQRVSRAAVGRVCFSVHPAQLRPTAASAEEIPVIRVPRYVQKRVENLKQTRGTNILNTIKAGKLLIQSRNATLNQSVGYTHGKFEEPPLCSKGWKHKKAYGDYFTINNIKSAAPFLSGTPEEDAEKPAKTFHKLHLSEELVETLERLNIRHPTTVQLQTIPKVMRGHNVLCAAETGSGKTLSYLLPIVHKLQLTKNVFEGAGSAKIRALILVPSRELTEQVAAVSRSLCVPFGMVTRTVGGGRGVGHIKNVFKQRIPDILVATPGALVKALTRRCLDLSELNFLVVDEADTMFDPSFADMMADILHYTEISRHPRDTQGPAHKAQLLVVGATFPGGVGDVLSHVTDLGSVVVIKSKMLHFLMPHVKQTFLKVKGADKILELNHHLKLHQQEQGGGGVLVFCNKSSTVNWLGYSLEEMGVHHVRLQGEMPATVRTGIFQNFQKGTVDVLLCTDIASRGLDTSRVRLVVNYDFPESHTDYIHRAGRVGRAGGVEGGKVLSFVTHPWEVELVQNIETSARRKTSLPGMESQIRKPKPELVMTEQSGAV